MTQDDLRATAIRLGEQIASDLAEFAAPRQEEIPGGLIEFVETPVNLADLFVARGQEQPAPEPRLTPGADLLEEYDRRILDPDLRAATRSRFVSKHYADAVEAGVKTLNGYVRSRTGRTEDGDELMTIVFSPNGALLRINRGKSKSDTSAQRGHMLLCQGVVGAWRNPRAHALVDDSPSRELMMLELIDDLLQVTRTATRTRKRKKT